MLQNGGTTTAEGATIGAAADGLIKDVTTQTFMKDVIEDSKRQPVLVDFWATWCPPCMAALPDVIEIYNEYHAKGLEIVGISLDKNQHSLEKVLERYKMPWPQYFDGMGWGNKFVIEYNVTAVPTMWLVDKTGKLRTMEAGADLEKQVSELLAEKL